MIVDVEDTGERFMFPDTATDDDIRQHFAQRGQQQQPGGAQGLVSTMMSLAQQYQQRPQTTLPTVGAKDTLGMSSQQFQAMTQNIQNDNIFRQEQTMKGIEAEKGRQQEIKLQTLIFKNQQAQEKLNSDARLAEAKARAQAPQKLSEGQALMGADGSLIAKNERPEKPYVLGDGAMAFDKNGKMIAENPKNFSPNSGRSGGSPFGKIVTVDGRQYRENPTTGALEPVELPASSQYLTPKERTDKEAQTWASWNRDRNWDKTWTELPVNQQKEKVREFVLASYPEAPSGPGPGAGAAPPPTTDKGAPAPINTDGMKVGESRYGTTRSGAVGKITKRQDGKYDFEPDPVAEPDAYNPFTDPILREGGTTRITMMRDGKEVSGTARLVDNGTRLEVEFD